MQHAVHDPRRLEQTKFGGGDDAKPAVRHDNHRKLARDAVIYVCTNRSLMSG